MQILENNKQPFVPGTCGVAEIVEIGSDVKYFKESDKVIIPYVNGAWCSYLNVNSDRIIPLPEAISVDQGALLSYAPAAAYCLLNNFTSVIPGDCILQASAQTAIGLSVVQLCSAKNIKTINIITNCTEYEETFRAISNLGGTVICSEEYSNSYKFKELVGTLQNPKLALDGMGGNAYIDLQRNLEYIK